MPSNRKVEHSLDVHLYKVAAFRAATAKRYLGMSPYLINPIRTAAAWIIGPEFDKNDNRNLEIARAYRKAIIGAACLACHVDN